MTGNVRGLVSRGKLAQDKANKALTMLKGVVDYSEFKDVDMVVEVGQVTKFNRGKFGVYKIYLDKML